MALQFHGRQNINTTNYLALADVNDTKPRRCFICCTINFRVSTDNAATNQLILSLPGHMLVDLGVVSPASVSEQATFSDTQSQASLFSLDPGEAR